jgi:hypothetical protein
MQELTFINKQGNHVRSYNILLEYGIGTSKIFEKYEILALPDE